MSDLYSSHSWTKVVEADFFVSEKRGMTLIDSPKGEIEAEDLGYKTIKEDWNIYDLEDGTRLRVKLVTAKISRGIDPATGKALILPNGEPLYNVRWTIAFAAEVPKETLQKLKS